MNQELIAEALTDRAEHCPPLATPGEDRGQEQEPLFFVVPPPPVPGMTSWSIAPL